MSSLIDNDEFFYLNGALHELSGLAYTLTGQQLQLLREARTKALDELTAQWTDVRRCRRTSMTHMDGSAACECGGCTVAQPPLAKLGLGRSIIKSRYSKVMPAQGR